MKNESYKPIKILINLMKRIRKLGLGENELKDVSISAAQKTLLDCISSSPGYGVKDIANALKQSAPTVSVAVRKLEKSNLVERKPNPMDRRSVQFYLTPAGDVLQKKIQKCHYQKFQLLLSGLASQEQEYLLKLLEKAINNAESKVPNNEIVDI
jgi:DNA-binding MarR family transcriptional regulator